MSVCRGCGKPIVWAVNDATGRKIPLDPKALVFRDDGHRTASGEPIVTRTTTDYVTHFATCPRANDFSASNKAKAGE